MSGSAPAVTALVFDASAAAAGAAQFDAAGKRIIATNDGVVTATTRTQTTIDGMDRALGRLQRQLDPVAAAQKRLADQQMLLDRALQRGKLSADEHARSIALATGQYDRAAAAAAKAVGSLNEIAAAAGRATRAQEAFNQVLGVQQVSQDAHARRAADVAAFGAELDRLRGKYDPLFAAQQRYRATLAEIAQAERVGALAAREAATAREATKAAFADQVRTLNGVNDAQGKTATGASNLGAAIGQAGFQVQDLTVQLAGGQNALLAFAQQGSQLAGFFGPTGAVVGAVLALAAVTAMLVTGGSEAERFTATMEKVSAAYDSTIRRAEDMQKALEQQNAQYLNASAAGARYRAGLQEEAANLVRLTDYYARLSEAQRNQQAAALEDQRKEQDRRRTELLNSMTQPLAARTDVGGAFVVDGGFSPAMEDATRAVRDFRAQGAVTVETVSALINRLRELRGGRGETWISEIFDDGSRAIYRQEQALTAVLAQVRELEENYRRLGVAQQAVANQDPNQVALQRGRATIGEVGGAYQTRQQIMQQRESLQGLLRASGATSEDVAAARSSLQALAQAMEGLTPATAQMLRGLREQAQLAGVAEGAARELALADMELDRASRAAGAGMASAAERAAVREAVQRRLNEEATNASVKIQDQVDAETALAAAWEQGARAAGLAEIANRAHTEALRYGVVGSVEYTRSLDRLRNGYEALAEAQRLVKDLREIFGQTQQLEMIRAEAALLGEVATVRERELAALRERQRIIAEGGDPETDSARRRITNAREISDATRELTRQRDAFAELERIGEQAFDRIGSAITEAFANGSMKAIDFGNLSKAVFAEIVQAALRLALINPIINSAFGGNRTTAWDVASAASKGGVAASGSGTGGLGGIGNIAGLFSPGGSSGIGSTINGWGVASGLFGSGTSATASSAIYGSGAAAYGGAMNSGAAMSGSGLFTSSTLSSSLAGAGVGFMGGSMLGGYIAGDSAAKQQNAQIGAGIGAGVGMIFGPVGGIVGGLIGGAAGGLIGPGAKTNAYGFGVTASGGQFGLDPLRMTGDGAGGEQIYAQVAQQLAQLNALLASANLTVNDNNRAITGRNSETQSASLEEAFRLFSFSAANDNRLNTAITGRQFDSADALAGFVAEVQQIGAAVDAIAAPVTAFQQSVNALAAGFDQTIEVAQKVGFGEAELRAEREKQINALFHQRDAQVALSRAEIAENLLRAEGRTTQAEAAQAQREATAAVDAYRENLKALGLAADEAAPHLAALNEQIAAQQAAVAAALRRQQREAIDAVDLRSRRAIAGQTGNAADAMGADLFEFDSRALSELSDLEDRLKALGFVASDISPRLGQLVRAHQAERDTIIATYQALRTAAAQALDDRLFAATTDTSTQAGAMAALERDQARERVEAARVGLADLVQLEEVHAAERADALKRFAEQERQAILSAGGSVRAYVDSLRSGAAGGASPEDRLTSAQGVFARDLELSRGGDRDALARITQSADSLLQSGQAMYASGSQFQALRGMVLSSLEALPAVKSYDQLIYETLAALGGSIQVEVEMAAELTLRADIDAALALIDTTKAIPRAKEEAEAALRELRGVLDAILVPGATTDLARTAAVAALSTITGAIVSIAIAPGTTEDAKFALLRDIGSITASLDVVADMSGIPPSQLDVLFSSAETIVRTLALTATGTALTPDQRALLEAEGGRFDRELHSILSGASILTADQRAILLAGSDTVTRTLRQQVETRETVEISRSLDDKIGAALNTLNYTVREHLPFLTRLPDVQAYLFHILQAARGASGGVRVTTLQSSGSLNGGFAYNGPQLPDQPGWGNNYGGLEDGGWVGNGIWNRDSVIARYAGGGDIALAGREFVVNATQAGRFPDVLESINDGTYSRMPSSGGYRGDDAAMLAELRGMWRELAELRGVRRELAQLRRLNDLVQITADAGNQNAAGHKQTARMLDQMRTGQQLARARPA